MLLRLSPPTMMEKNKMWELSAESLASSRNLFWISIPEFFCGWNRSRALTPKSQIVTCLKFLWLGHTHAILPKVRVLGVSHKHSPTPTLIMNDGQEAFRRFANQLRTVGGNGGKIPGGPGGLFAGSGLLIALVAGGFALNASLFNGMSSVCIFGELS